MRISATCLASLLLFAAPALAQEAADPPAAPTDGEAPSDAPPPPDRASADREDGPAPSAPVIVNVQTAPRDELPPPQSPFDPHELPSQGYHHVGVFARGIFAPQAIQNIFVAGGTNALNVGVGAFYNYRRDGLNIIAEVWWAGFYGQAPFRGLNETDFQMEWVESELNVVFGSLAVMWSIPIASWLAFEIGFGIGFGGVFGGLYRTEAYPTPDGWRPCSDVGDPDAAYCDERNPDGHYQRRDGTPEPYNFGGGVPPLFFWVDLPRVAIRIQPVRQLQIRVEGGFAAYAIYFGGSLAFGF